MNKRYGIIILNYNGWRDTIACLESLMYAKIGQSQVFLFDNASENNSVIKIKSWNKKSKFFTQVLEDKIAFSSSNIYKNKGNIFCLNSKNHGFARGNNLGIRLAQCFGIEYILLLNNDTIVDSNFLFQLDKILVKHPNVILTPQIRLYNNTDIIWNCGGRIIYPGIRKYFFANKHYKSLPKKNLLRITFVTGCALLFKPQIHGLLTERFFFGEEDMDFSIRMKQKGIHIYCVLNSIIYHKVGTTLKNNPRKSEIFVLKRLINIRHNYSYLSYIISCVLYGFNLKRILIKEYGISLIQAIKISGRIVLLSNKLNRVGKPLAVDYVRMKTNQTFLSCIKEN